MKAKLFWQLSNYADRYGLVLLETGRLNSKRDLRLAKECIDFIADYNVKKGMVVMDVMLQHQEIWCKVYCKV